MPPDRPEELIEAYLPMTRFRSRHELLVHASPSDCHRAMIEIDMGRSRVIRGLFFLRGLPTRGLTLERMEKLGFSRLENVPGRGLVIGIVGRFWTLHGALRTVDAEGFRGFAEPGFARAVWTFEVAALEDRPGWSRVWTETRIQCLDEKSERRFRLYWSVVAPFSGWTRREMLRLVKEEAEARKSQ